MVEHCLGRTDGYMIGFQFTELHRQLGGTGKKQLRCLFLFSFLNLVVDVLYQCLAGSVLSPVVSGS